MAYIVSEDNDHPNWDAEVLKAAFPSFDQMQFIPKEPGGDDFILKLVKAGDDGPEVVEVDIGQITDATTTDFIIKAVKEKLDAPINADSLAAADAAMSFDL